ncbi:inositol monophosphatase family protein [Undibacterium terreum]|uniref:Inositol phosphatase n=1 Tax=Undibacterium terreum TaxID=1224302 RepID=A0A916UBQ5_9BURK|nr:inositol monophosphatase family protein [Undibacterium terreum]GGC66396.1 inositol phosphatase [Undibacterium terreum]
MTTNTQQTQQNMNEEGILLAQVVQIIQSAGQRLKERYSAGARPRNAENLVAALDANDAASLDILRDALSAARPGAQWAEDEVEGGMLPAGEWWIVDPVEGNINHIHGMEDWSVTATLVRDNIPVLTAIYLPLSGQTYTAIRGHGAWLNGSRLHASVKTALNTALVATGQAKPGEGKETYRRIGQSVTAMLEAALVVRVSVPATSQLLHVAAGSMDAFWQFSNVRSGLVAGALLAAEAGAIVTDTHGRPWTLASDNFLASAPAVHADAVAVLCTIV